MKLHFCEAKEIENLKGIESERKQSQQDWIAIFEFYFRGIKKEPTVLDWKETIQKGLIGKEFEQKRYDWKALD